MYITIMTGIYISAILQHARLHSIFKSVLAVGPRVIRSSNERMIPNVAYTYIWRHIYQLHKGGSLSRFDFLVKPGE